MKKVLTLILLCLALPTAVFAQNITINGAGATFPYPLYAQWAYQYEKLTGVKLNYQSIGSGGGIAQIKAKTVDFGASDAPMDVNELDEIGLIQFPMVIGGVVPVVNIKGIKSGQIRLTPDVLADLFLGKITKWNDPRIVKLNSDVALPDKAVTVVHRADGSGTTWIFTNYLDKVSKQWHETVGTGKAVAWPTGVGGKGNEGVAGYVQRVDGSIGYVEYAYALQNNLTYVLLGNRAGKFVPPTIKTFQAAAANADWKNAPGYYMVLTDQPGDDSWPITGASFILMYKVQSNARQAKAMLKFFDWCFRHGADKAQELHYVPIPLNVVELVEKSWSEQINAGQPLWP
ncbi:MAG: phosphate ABC transporter substrate-binding protein PstS [Planctomycetes bacterium RBG_13_46_10]|nr:MAG: phosphate ABC transporter substrate-binding protein PstS [Planctomycetes bacterium RBG_13_46_10]